VPHRRLTLRSLQNARGLTIPRSGSYHPAGTLNRVVAAPLSTRRRAIYAALALLSLFSVALIATRYFYSREPLFGGLIWNLFLAWIPFGLSVLIYDRHRAGARLRSLVPLAALWLLFLPNAPYILTDFKHLFRARSCRSGSMSS